MINRKANQRASYLIMKLDFLLDRFDDYGTVDSYDLRDFAKIFRQLPLDKQETYGWMIDQAWELYDCQDQPEQ
jgi:hypothetical protein